MRGRGGPGTPRGLLAVPGLFCYGIADGRRRRRSTRRRRTAGVRRLGGPAPAGGRRPFAGGCLAPQPGMETPDILVIGGGIIGCSLARELARAGRSVVVLERGQVGCAASSAAAGLLAPTLAAPPPPALAELCYQSAALYEFWLG